MRRRKEGRGGKKRRKSIRKGRRKCRKTQG